MAAAAPRARPERPRAASRTPGVSAETTGEHRRRHRLEMGLASHRGVERFEAPGGIEQQGRSVAAARAGERDLRAQALQPRALKLVERGKLGGGQQLERRVRCRGLELRLRGGQGPPAPLRRIRGQLRRVRQERRGRCGPSTGLCPVGRALQLGGHRLVDAHRRVGEMPRRRSGSVSGSVASANARCAARRSDRGSSPVHGGAHQWMPEADTGSDLDELRVLCRRERAPFDAEHAGGAPDERRVTDRLGRGQQQQPLRRLG